MAQTLTVAEMKARVNAHIRDADNVFVTATEILGWLNDGCHDLAARTRTIRREATGTQSDNTLTLPTDFLEPITLRLGDDDDVEFVDDDVWWTWSDAGADLTHTIARVFGANIDLYPTPAASTAYVLRYISLPAELTADGDISELPANLHPKATLYALWQAMMKLAEDGKADRFLGMYEEGLPPLPTGTARFNPGPITLWYQPGPFDEDPQARHV